MTERKTGLPDKFMTITVPTPSGHSGYILSGEELDVIISAMSVAKASFPELLLKLTEIRACFAQPGQKILDAEETRKWLRLVGALMDLGPEGER